MARDRFLKPYFAAENVCCVWLSEFYFIAQILKTSLRTSNT